MLRASSRSRQQSWRLASIRTTSRWNVTASSRSFCGSRPNPFDIESLLGKISSSQPPDVAQRERFAQRNRQQAAPSLQQRQQLSQQRQQQGLPQHQEAPQGPKDQSPTPIKTITLLPPRQQSPSQDIPRRPFQQRDSASSGNAVEGQSSTRPQTPQQHAGSPARSSADPSGSTHRQEQRNVQYDQRQQQQDRVQRPARSAYERAVQEQQLDSRNQQALERQRTAAPADQRARTFQNQRQRAFRDRDQSFAVRQSQRPNAPAGSRDRPLSAREAFAEDFPPPQGRERQSSSSLSRQQGRQSRSPGDRGALRGEQLRGVGADRQRKNDDRHIGGNRFGQDPLRQRDSSGGDNRRPRSDQRQRSGSERGVGDRKSERDQMVAGGRHKLRAGDQGEGEAADATANQAEASQGILDYEDFNEEDPDEAKRKRVLKSRKEGRVPEAQDWSVAEPIEETDSSELNERLAALAKRRDRYSTPAKLQKPKEVFLPQIINVQNLSRLLGVKVRSLQRAMGRFGIADRRPDALMRFDDAAMICAEYNLNAVSNDAAAFDIYPSPAPSVAERAELPFRAPVVTVMGHVDHGKTSLLDRLRSASVAAGEAGGITQHIGAFSVPVKAADGSKNSVNEITFLDTPGHAAFTNMRARGAKVTDIVVLVVAADDGVMAQTKEVIGVYQGLEAEAQAAALEEEEAASANDTDSAVASSRHASEIKRKQNNIQLVVALSKCDRPEADPTRVKEQLGAEGIVVEELGGDVPCVEISSKTGEGFDNFQETLAVMAELGDIRAVDKGLPEGVVLESRTEKGRGDVATVLVTRGVLQTGSFLIAGETWAKARALVDSAGKAVKTALPGQAVLVSGWRALPSAGEEVLSAAKEDEVKRALENRKDGNVRRKMIQEAEAVNEARRRRNEEQEAVARLEFEKRAKMRDERIALAEGKISIEELAEQAALEAELAKDETPVQEGEGDLELRVIIKSDYSGTGEALAGALEGVKTKGGRLRVMAQGVGDINENDLALARSSEAHILGFNVVAPRNIQNLANQGSTGDKKSGKGASSSASDSQQSVTRMNKVEIFTSKIIYQIIDYCSSSLLALFPPIYKTRVLGEANIAQIFEIAVKGRSREKVAGCRIFNGLIDKTKLFRVLRKKPSSSTSTSSSDDDAGNEGDGRGGRVELWSGRLGSLKNVKQEVSEMRKGSDCGMSFTDFQDFEVGDVVQAYELIEVPRKL